MWVTPNSWIVPHLFTKKVPIKFEHSISTTQNIKNSHLFSRNLQYSCNIFSFLTLNSTMQLWCLWGFNLTLFHWGMKVKCVHSIALCFIYIICLVWIKRFKYFGVFRLHGCVKGTALVDFYFFSQHSCWRHRLKNQYYTPHKTWMTDCWKHKPSMA